LQKFTKLDQLVPVWSESRLAVYVHFTGKTIFYSL